MLTNSLLTALLAMANVVHAVPATVHRPGVGPKNGTFAKPVPGTDGWHNVVHGHGHVHNHDARQAVGVAQNTDLPSSDLPGSPPQDAPSQPSASPAPLVEPYYDPYPGFDEPRCESSTDHPFVSKQQYVFKDGFQITPDCFAYGVGGYAAMLACARRNVCFGNCAKTYKECVTEWMEDPETHAAHQETSNDTTIWENLPVHQYLRFDRMSCKCLELKACGQFVCP